MQNLLIAGPTHKIPGKEGPMNETTISRDDKAQSLALDILTLARNTLLVQFRFLDRAISRIQFVPGDTIWFGCDS